MITKLPEWYHVSKLKGLSAETLELRSADIVKIVKMKKFDLILNCIRLFLNKPLSNQTFSDELSNLFLEGDSMFPQKNNKLELRVLAGAILHEYIFTGKSKDRIFAALAFQTGLFGVDKKSLINVDIIKSISQFITYKALELRENVRKEPLTISIDPTVPDASAATLSQKFTGVNDQLKTLSTYVNESINKRIEIFEEESNIHWWIFRSFSNDLGVPIKDVEYRISAIIIGRELSNLVTIIPGPPNSDQYLKKVLHDNSSQEKETVLKDCINGLEKNYKEQILEKNNLVIGNLCPLMVAYSKAIESGDKTSWLATFENATGLNPNLKASRLDLALQSYYESLLVRSFS